MTAHKHPINIRKTAHAIMNADTPHDAQMILQTTVENAVAATKQELRDRFLIDADASYDVHASGNVVVLTKRTSPDTTYSQDRQEKIEAYKPIAKQVIDEVKQARNDSKTLPTNPPNQING